MIRRRSRAVNLLRRSIDAGTLVHSWAKAAVHRLINSMKSVKATFWNSKGLLFLSIDDGSAAEISGAIWIRRLFDLLD